MPDAQLTVPMNTCLNEDIAVELDTIVDSTKIMGEKYSILLACGRELGNRLAAKQEELVEAQIAFSSKQTELNATRTQLHEEVSIQTAAATKALVRLRSANRMLKQERGRNADLGRRNKQLMDQVKWANEQAKLLATLSAELRALQEQLELVDHLRCEICVDRFKRAVTRCGHGYCNECLETWMHSQSGHADPTHQHEARRKYTCPTCRSSLDANRDVWPIYLGDDDAATEVISLESDED